MGKPVWGTAPGNLGTIEEGVFYNLEIEASDPDGGDLEYIVIAGYMPPGLVINESNGTISGRPKILYEIRGVPSSVDQDVTSTFCCRVTSSTTGQITDRTFSITVTGQDAPTIETKSQSLGTIFDGTFFSTTIKAQDLDNEPLSYTISAGRLPPGITLDAQTGVISGYATPVTTTSSADTVGWSASEQGWNEYPWDHTESWINENYQFTVEVTDGKEFAQQSYTLLVLAKSLLSADVLQLTGDDALIATADMTKKHIPVLVTDPGDLGIYEHDNYFAYQFKGIDFDNDEIEFGISSPGGTGFDDIEGSGFDSDLFDQGDLSMPNGLTLNSETGWLYGYISTQQLAQIEYTFGVYVYKKNNTLSRSDNVFFTLTVVNDLVAAIVWKTPQNLGTISTGSISELAIETTNSIGYSVNYTLKSDPFNSSLPQGLKLNNDGLLVGRVSFEHTTFDNGITTFDEDTRELGSRLNPVTFDIEYTFTVVASSPNGEISAERTFTLTIDPITFAPYESLYLKANPGTQDKDLFRNIALNTDILPANDVYRSSDPNFGISQDVRMLLISGLQASAAGEYIQAMSQAHYRKTLRFSIPKVSKAYDINQNLLYEVIYYELSDNGSTIEGSVGASIDLNNKINRNITVDSENVTLDNTYHTMDGAGDNIVYPNSLTNMRNRLEDEIGLNVREVLPQWMSNRQTDGSIIGWKPAAVLAYVKPGAGDRILFNLKRRTDLDQKLISFEVDRYILDNNLSKTYDTNTGEYLESSEVTFDATNDDDSSSSESTAVTVDFALDIPFNQIHGRSTAYIDAAGGLDNLILSYENKTVVFATQENYLLYNEENDGWNRTLDFYDDADGYDINGYSNQETVPGYSENFSDPSIANQRAGVWKIVKDADNDVWLLEFQQELELNNTVTVRNGFKYGGYVLEYNPTIDFAAGDTVPKYAIINPLEVIIPTTFDNNNTRFINNVISYEPPDANDKYLVFPKENIWS
jgi:hypothetical protein